MNNRCFLCHVCSVFGHFRVGESTDQFYIVKGRIRTNHSITCWPIQDSHMAQLEQGCNSLSNKHQNVFNLHSLSRSHSFWWLKPSQLLGNFHVYKQTKTPKMSHTHSISSLLLWIHVFVPITSRTTIKQIHLWHFVNSINVFSTS